MLCKDKILSLHHGEAIPPPGFIFLKRWQLVFYREKKSVVCHEVAPQVTNHSEFFTMHV